MHKRFTAPLFLTFVILLASCASSSQNSSPPASTPKQAPSVTAQEYKIQAGDGLLIKFYFNSDLNDDVVVRPDGRISLQLVDEVVAAGLTPAALRDLLKVKYSKELDKPEIMVTVKTFGGQMVFVDGEVNKAGMFNLTSPITVLQALSMAGGVKETARRDEIVLIRRGVDNKPITRTVNIDKVYDGTEMTQDITLRPNDIVYVPRTGIANVDIWVDQYLRKILPIQPALFYNIH